MNFNVSNRTAELLTSHTTLGLHLVSAHAFSPSVLTDSPEAQIEQHEHEHAGQWIIRDHPRGYRHFSAAKVDEAFAAQEVIEEYENRGGQTEAAAAEPAPQPVAPGATADMYAIGDRPTEHAVGVALRAAYDRLNKVDAITMHGDIARRDALTVIIDLARENGVAL